MTLLGIHHLKFPVADLDTAERFYTTVFGARRRRDADHVDAAGTLYAIILDVPGLDCFVELRHDPDRAAAGRGHDPVTFAVADRPAIATWAAHLDTLGVPHSGELIALRGWLLVFADPDGTRLRLYTRAGHGPELGPTSSSPWL